MNLLERINLKGPDIDGDTMLRHRVCRGVKMGVRDEAEGEYEYDELEDFPT